jgi:hypothetical protein
VTPIIIGDISNYKPLSHAGSTLFGAASSYGKSKQSLKKDSL